MRTLLGMVIVAAFAAGAAGQDERYELGRRLQRFEAAWEKQPDAAARTRAAKRLPDLTAMFFSLRFGEAGRTLDRARWALGGPEEPPAAVQWLESLYPMPDKFLLTSEKTLTVTVKPFYPVKGDPPPTATVTVQLDAEKPVPVPLGKFPVKLTLAVSGVQGTVRLKFVAALDGKPVAESTQVVAVVPDLAMQLDRFRTFAKQTPPTLETATVRDRVDLLTELADGTVPETNLPAYALVSEGTRILDSPTYFGPSRPGQFWLSVPVGKKTLPVRLFVPKGLDAKSPVPLVVALHGAGGSENLFFDGYGAGHIVKACEKRGWLLVAPRSGISFGSGPPVKDLLDKLAERYPVDRAKVFLVGHSMGSVQTVALCQEHPGLFAAAAALGGGGRVKDTTPFAKLPFFVGVGDKDFARGQAKDLAKALKDGGAEKLTFQEYPDREHLLVVREALPEIFAMWDTLARGK